MSAPGFLRGFKRFEARFYERVVASVKSCLKKVLRRSFATFEELQTVLCEKEAVINSHPLAYVSEDNLDEALTSFHLTHGRNICKLMKLTESVINSRLDQ